MKKTTLALCLSLVFLSLNAQLKFDYSNPELSVPDFLINPNHIQENTDEETEIDITENILCNIGDYTIVSINYGTTIHNSGDDVFYLASFNKQQKLIDFTYVHEYSTWDWNWTTELAFDCTEQNRITYYHVMEWHRPAESDEEMQEYGGMVLDRADTTDLCFEVTKEGEIFDCEAVEEDELITEEFDEDLAVEQIREWFSEINKQAPGYLKKNRKHASVILTSYFEGDELKKITATNTSAKIVEEFYFNDNELIFVFSFDKTTKTGNRCYFYDSGMFRWLKGNEKTPVSPGSEDFYKKEQNLLSKVKEYLNSN